jgi:hypothetical protein
MMTRREDDYLGAGATPSYLLGSCRRVALCPAGYKLCRRPARPAPPFFFAPEESL